MQALVVCPLVALSVAVATGCLPKDTRPPPGELNVTATSDDALNSGFTTDDGWTVAFDRFLVAVGHASVEGDECIGYSDPDYGRLLDMTRAGTQKVSVIFAIGACEFDWELSTPNEDAVLGKGVTEADRTLMRTPGSSLFAKDSGVSILVEGSAKKGSAEKTFAWAYRHRIDSSACKATIDGVVVEGVQMKENGVSTVDLTVGGGTLFRDQIDDGPSKLVFDPVAAADDTEGNGDGKITLDELDLVLLKELPGYGGFEEWNFDSLADFIYLGQFPKLIRFRGNGTCEGEIFPNDRTPR